MSHSINHDDIWECRRGTYSSGDKVCLIIDFEKRSIDFLNNGSLLGVAYTNMNGPVRAVVRLLNAGDAVRLLRVQ